MDKRTALTYIDSNGNWHRASKGAPEQVGMGSIPRNSPNANTLCHETFFYVCRYWHYVTARKMSERKFMLLSTSLLNVDFDL